jgi:hypothetical protein
VNGEGRVGDASATRSLQLQSRALRLQLVSWPAARLTELLTTMPGIGEFVAQVILGEIGAGMSRFPTAGHLISWAGLCPARTRAPASDHFDRRDKTQIVKRLTRRIEDPGFEIQLRPAA